MTTTLSVKVSRGNIGGIASDVGAEVGSGDGEAV